VTPLEPDSAINDRDIRDAVRAAGIRPSEVFRAELHGLLVDGGAEHNASATAHELRPVANQSARRRSQWPVLVTAATTIVLAVTAVAFVSRTDEPNVSLTDPTNNVDVVGIDGRELLDQLDGHTWIAVDHPGPNVPSFVIDSRDSGSGTIMVSGFDGCNTYEGPITIDGSTVVQLKSSPLSSRNVLTSTTRGPAKRCSP
jgi:hypothetical protein